MKLRTAFLLTLIALCYVGYSWGKTYLRLRAFEAHPRLIADSVLVKINGNEHTEFDSSYVHVTVDPIDPRTNLSRIGAPQYSIAILEEPLLKDGAVVPLEIDGVGIEKVMVYFRVKEPEKK